MRACAVRIICQVKVQLSRNREKMASADLSFTKDGLIYRPQHLEEDDDEDFLTGHSQKDGGTIDILYMNGMGGVILL